MRAGGNIAIVTGFAVFVLGALSMGRAGSPGAERPNPDFPRRALSTWPHEKPPAVPPPALGPKEVSPPLPPEMLRRGQYQSVQVNVDADGNNIKGDAANEPSIAMDPTNPKRLVIGWRQFDTKLSDFREAGWAYSHNGGQKWTFPGVLQDGVFRSDPVLAADPEGAFYFYSLSNTVCAYCCELFKSTDGGVSWAAPIPAYGGDKPWIVIDHTMGIGHGNLYATWSILGSVWGFGTFTRSTDAGKTFTYPVEVPDWPIAGTLAIGPNGEVYVGGGWPQSDDFWCARSSNAQDPSATPAFDLSAPVDLGGALVVNLGTGPNPQGLLGQVWVACDQSDGPTRGNVYMLCSVDPPGIDPLDVMFARSTDGGKTWSAPLRVNDDAQAYGHWQWFGTMSVAPNGRIDVIWNDTRKWAQSSVCEVYYSYSTDGGVTWSPNVPATPQFKSDLGYPQQKKLGDYYHMISDNDGASLAYAATFNYEQDIYFLRIPFCADAGKVILDRTHYACESVVGITVNDCGLNPDDEIVDTAQVTISSDSEPGGESVVLTETGVSSGVFEGDAVLSGTGAAGALLVADGDTVTVTYIDADDGAGGSDITVTAIAAVDCTPPAISDVLATEIGSSSAKIRFNADEPVRAMVLYGLSCDALDQAVSSAVYETSPSVALSGLAVATKYYYAVKAEDLAGNTTYDNHGGQCYSFTTLNGPQPVYRFPLDDDPGWPAQGQWAFGQPKGLGGMYWGYPDPTSGATGTNVYGVNLMGDYSVTPAGPYYVTLGPVDLTDVMEASLRFERWLNSDFEPFVIDTIEVSTSGGGWTEVWSNDDDEIAEYAWTLQKYDIAGLADDQPTVHIRWGYQIGPGAWAYSGWNIDDIEIWGVIPVIALGDMNCDGIVDTTDIDPFVLALTNPAAYVATYPECDILKADCSEDGAVNAFDIDPFVSRLPAP